MSADGTTLPRFEGSYMGADAKISPQAVMECKICWSVYDPDIGDDTRQVLPGTAFSDLPDDWTCPECGGAREQFMVLRDPGSQAAAVQRRLDDLTSRLVADFTEIYHAKMRDVPVINKALHVEAVGFMQHADQVLGVLISPWFMNLVLLPGADQDWSGLVAGAKEDIVFPSGTYEFIHNVREQVGGYKACSLFSPMGDFTRQKDAVDVAQAVMQALFDPENQAETDRSADIRAAREAELAAAEAAEDEPRPDPAPTRRRVITGGLAADAPDEEAGDV